MEDRAELLVRLLCRESFLVYNRSLNTFVLPFYFKFRLQNPRLKYSGLHRILCRHDNPSRVCDELKIFPSTGKRN